MLFRSGASATNAAIWIQQGVLQVTNVGNATALNSLGKSTNAVTLGDGTNTTVTFRYIGTDASPNCGKSFVLATNGGGIFDITNAGTTLQLSGATITGSGTLTKIGLGTLLMGTSNTMSGNMIINAGTLKCNNAYDFPNSGSVTINANGKVDLNGKNPTINGLSGSGVLDSTATNTDKITVNEATGQTTTFSGIITNSGFSAGPGGAGPGGVSLGKTGSGTLILTGNNGFNGQSTSVNLGVLDIAGGSLANTAITVANTGTLAVKPGSATTITAGNTATVGTGASLILNGKFDMTDGAISTFQLVQEATFAGTQLLITNNGVSTLKFNVGNSGADLLAVSGTAAVTNTVIISLDTSLMTSPVPGTYDLITAASGLTSGGATWQLPTGGTTTNITVGANNYSLKLNTNSDTDISVTVASLGGSSPTANPDSASTYWNVPVMIMAVANDTDPNSHPLTIVSVSPTNGTASIVNSTNVLFTPTSGFARTGHVGYTITNGNGGSATSLVTITINTPPTPRMAHVTAAGGSLVLSGTNGAPNGAYTIVASTNVALAVSSWTPVATNLFDGSGNFSNSIPVTNTVPQDFFLLKQ